MQLGTIAYFFPVDSNAGAMDCMKRANSADRGTTTELQERVPGRGASDTADR